MTDTPAEVAEALDVLVERADVDLAWKRPSSELADTIRAHIADLQSQLAAQRERDGRDADYWREHFIEALAARYMDSGLMRQAAHVAAEKDAAGLDALKDRP
jgi:hypothetical protein